MSGAEKDHWLWNTRANDTGSIVDVTLGLFDSRLRGVFYGLPPRLVNFTVTVTVTVTVLVRLRTSAFMTLRCNHHWVVGYRLSGRSPPLRGCASDSFFLVATQVSSLLECLHVYAPFFITNTIHG